MCCLLHKGTETCGFLLGFFDEPNAYVEHWASVRNLAAGEGWFSVDTEQERQVQQIARQRGLFVVGFGHSHPSPSLEFSPVDIMTCHTRPYFWLLFVHTKGYLQFAAVRVLGGITESVKVV